MTTTKTLLALGAGISAIALAGCSVSGQSDTAEDGGESVTIMTHDSFDISDELIEQFEEESGYTLTTTSPGDAGALSNQLVLQKDSPTVDGVYGIDNYSTGPVLEAGALAEYSPENLPDGSEALIPDGAADQLTPIDQGQTCVNVDHAWFEESDLEEPETFEDLASPEYAELLVTIDPTQSATGLGMLVATIADQGDDGWQDYWTDLLDNGAKVASGWSDAYYSDFSGAEGEGDYPLVASYSSSPSAEGGSTGVLEDTCTTQVEYAAVVEGSDNPEGAEAFIDFMLEEDFQSALYDSMFMYPVDEDIEMPEEWAEHAELAENPLEVDDAVFTERRDQWLEEWNTLYEDQ